MPRLGLMVVLGLALPCVVGVAVLVTCAGLAGLARPMGSSAYRPTSPWEAEAFAATRRDISPDGVRAREAPPQVAWAGVIRAWDTRDDGGGFALRLLLEHRYFDWIEDHGRQEELYFVSPRGEGTFETCWWMPASWHDGIVATVHDGDLVLVYGPATRSEAGIVIVPPRYLRTVPPELWRDDVLDYGNDGAPARLLRTPLPGDPRRRAPLAPLAVGRAPTVTGPCRAEPPARSGPLAPRGS